MDFRQRVFTAKQLLSIHYKRFKEWAAYKEPPQLRVWGKNNTILFKNDYNEYANENYNTIRFNTILNNRYASYYCELDFVVYKMVRYNQVTTWSMIGRRLGVVKDVRIMIASMIYSATEANYNGFASVNTRLLSKKQVEIAFYSTKLDPKLARNILKCKIFTWKERAHHFLSTQRKNIIAHCVVFCVVWRYSRIMYSLLYLGLVGSMAIIV